MTNSSEDPVRHVIGAAAEFLYPAALRAVVLLGVADHLADGPLPLGELAALTGANGPFLHRLLRFLASRGTFREDEDGLIHLTPYADVLRTDAPGSVRAGVLTVTSELWWHCASDLVEAVRHGEPAFDRRFGRPLFTYLAENPDVGAMFNAGMASYSAADVGYVVEGYDFPPAGVVVDVGSGRGGLLAALLRKNPGLHGILLDHESVLAEHVLGDLDGRWEPVAGDFFESVPAGDLHVVKSILHDWDDDQAVRILVNCRRALNPGGRILAVDTVIPPGDEPHFGRTLDMIMLMLLPGQERSLPEWEQLFDRAGLRITRVTPTPGHLSMMEAEPA
jgi:SAM-dependent methyltransferase